MPNGIGKMHKCRIMLIFFLNFAPVLSAGIFETAIEKIRQLDSQEMKKQLEEAGRKLQRTRLNDYLKQGYEKFNELIETSPSEPTTGEKNRQTLKFFLENLGKQQFGEDGKTFNEKASELILRIRPDLKDTDLAADPVRSVYFFLALDPGGFIDNVKIIRGPMNAPMTLREAYQFYYRTSPEKAAKILILLETLQKIGAPTTDEDQLEVILKAIKTNIELLNHPDTDK